MLPKLADVVPDAPGSIAGVVSNSVGTPLVNIEVAAFWQPSSGNWQLSRVVQTNATGEYKIGLLGAGIYRLLFRDPTHALAPIYYPSATTIDTATDIPVAGTNIIGINATLSASGRITGTVTNASNSIQPLGGGSLGSFVVDAYQKIGSRWVSMKSYTASASAGATLYTIDELTAGVYRLCVTNYATSSPGECYDNVYKLEDGADIAVVAGETTANINFVLGDGADFAQITGTVRAIDGSPLAAIGVSASRTTNDANSGWYAYTQTNTSGVYQLPNLLPGRYTIAFQDDQGAYVSAIYSNALTIYTATPVTLTRYEKRANVNASLTVAAHITGTVTVTDGFLVSAGYVSVYAKSNNDYVRSSQFDAHTGQYSIGGLPAGIYKVQATTSVDNYPFSGFYGGKTLEAATPITLSVGETRTHITVPLTQDEGDPIYSGRVAGVATADGAPAANIKVSIYQISCCSSAALSVSDAQTITPALSSNRGSADVMPNQAMHPASAQTTDDIKPLVYVYTDANGRYTIDGLSTGTYYLGFSDPAAIYATVYYPTQKVLAQAHPLFIRGNSVQLSDGTAIAAVNAALVRGGGISGSVRLKDDTPVANLVVQVYVVEEFGYIVLMTDELRTDALGNFTIQGLPAGLYRLCFVDLAGQHQTECYGEITPNRYPYQATNIVVQGGRTVSGIHHIWGPKWQFFLPVIQQKLRVGDYFNSAIVTKCEPQPAGNWFEGTTNVNGQPQSGYLVVFSYAPDGPIIATIQSGLHGGYPAWNTGYYSHMISATGPRAGNWSVWIIDGTWQRISEIATWQSTGPGEGCNQATIDFNSQ